MPELETIIDALFAGEFSLEKLITILVSVYAVVMSVVSLVRNHQAIVAKRDLTGAELEVQDLKTEVSELKQGIGVLGDIVVTAFLSSPATTVPTKKALASSAKTLETVAKIELSSMTNDILDTITKYVPGSTLAERKEEILEVTKKAEDIIDKASEEANDVVDKLQI